MHELMKKTCEALEEIEHSGRLNIMDNADRKIVSELVDLKKNLLKVQTLEDEMGDYSQDDGMDYGHGSSYAGRRGRGIRRDGRGRYSRDDGRSEMMEYIEKAMDAANEKDRETIKRFIRQLENA